eukprot:XP_019925707.1 PREDICTED: uncharacterized protein LOC105335173 [Crassostrea gigas]
MPLFQVLLIMKCGLLCLVQSKPSKPKITGDLNVEVNRYIELTCSSQSTLAPFYYSKLFTLSYTWFVNDTKMDGETRGTLRLYVTRDLKYNRYSCTATEEDMESDRSDSIQINPLYGPDRIIITPEPGKLTVREGETIGPFVCTADCNPTCSITWRVKNFDVFSDARSEMETLLQQAVQRGMQLFRCKADWREITFKENIQLDVQYLDGPLLYIIDKIKSYIELTEYAPLRISCQVDGNPAPTIRLSRGQADTELDERKGTWLNYTIDTAQCTHTDTYRCSGRSTGFNITEKVININVLCYTSNFKSTFGSKSGIDTKVNVAVPIIANPPPRASDFKWDGPVPVSVRTTISRGDVTYKHLIRSSIPVKDRNYFGNYTLSYNGEIITKITINPEGQHLQISTRFMSGNVIFTWTPSNYSSYDVLITRDTTSDTLWTRVSDTQYTVRDVLLYEKITINVRETSSSVDNRLTYNVFKIKTKVGDTVNLSWTAPFFPVAGQYNVYHTYSENRTIFSIRSSGVSYGGNNQSTKYTYLTRPFTSTNIMFSIRDITLDDAGYYNGGTSDEAAWSGGGVVLVVHNKPSKPKVTGDLNVEVNRYITLTCSSQSTSAPVYYSKLLTLSHTWLVNETRISGETRETLRLYVTKNLKYNRYTCTAREDDMESDRSDPVQINPLYGPDIIIITPEPKLNINDKLTVREGDTIGPFVCTADCNPLCNITWRVKTSDGFSDARSEMGTLLKQPVQRDMQLFRCQADRGNRILKQGFQLDVQYLDDTLLYINGEMKSNIELNENAPLRISCHVDGNPAPTIRLSRGQADTVLEQRQGTWLNYTIDMAQCTDTDTYRCRGTSTGFSNTDKVININVLCNTRFDKADRFKSTYGSKSGSDTTITVTVPIIAYPPPQSSDFKWDGPVSVSARTTFSTGYVSYKHVIESFIPVKDHTYFGNYTLSYKGQTVTRITINAEDVPQTPTNFTGYSYTNGSVSLTWVSGFNGGPEQFFLLYAMEGSNWKVIGNVSDPGEGRLVFFDPRFLSPGQEYSFRIQSCNRMNCSLLSADTKVTVKDNLLENSSMESAGEVASRSCIIAISLVSLLLGLTWFMVAVFVLYNRRCRNVHQNSKHDEESTQLQTQNMTQHTTDVWVSCTCKGSELIRSK